MNRVKWKLKGVMFQATGKIFKLILSDLLNATSYLMFMAHFLVWVNSLVTQHQLFDIHIHHNSSDIDKKIVGKIMQCCSRLSKECKKFSYHWLPMTDIYLNWTVKDTYTSLLQFTVLLGLYCKSP